MSNTIYVLNCKWQHNKASETVKTFLERGQFHAMWFNKFVDKQIKQ